MNPFEILGVAPRFSLDPSELSARQRELSRALHPDKFVGRPSSERRAALGRAIEVNEAYRALKNPLTRAEALLEVLGLTVPEGKEPVAPKELLMEIMERREALRAAGRARDEAAIESMASEVRREVSALESELGSQFSVAASNRITNDSSAASQIHQAVSNLRYLRRFLTEADAILDDLL